MSVETLRVGLLKANEYERRFPDELVDKAMFYVTNIFQSLWTKEKDYYVLTYEEALAELTLDKSPGYPYYFDCPTKLEALDRYSDVIKMRTLALLAGDDVECIFGLTEKSELRDEERVKAGKTRAFMSAPIHHLIASIMLFGVQNNDLVSKRSQWQSTIGIQMPGPEFVSRISSLGNKCNDGDVSGNDLRFKLQIARQVRQLRKRFLPPQYSDCIDTLYDTVYAGHVAGVGGIYAIDGNKSGWFNTAHDNTIQTLINFYIASIHFFPDQDPEDVITMLINGDDLAVAMKMGDFREFCIWLRQYNFVVEASNWEKRHFSQIVYLSHYLESRFVTGFGHFTVAAGNLDKILSSVNYIKKSKTLSYEESCVAHLVGLRMCLYPWKVFWDDIDNLLSSYLQKITMTPFIRGCLNARFSERQMAILHTKVEGVDFFSNSAVHIRVHMTIKMRWTNRFASNERTAA